VKQRNKAQIWLFRGDRVLILRRRLDTDGGMAGIWQPITGHVETGESFAIGAQREAHEETGIALETPVRKLGGYEFDDRWGTHCIEEIFAMAAPADFEVTLDPTEHIAFEWVTLPEALNRVAYPPPAEAVANLQMEIQNGRD
jgi:dATP pyrophosphohydrolase